MIDIQRQYTENPILDELTYQISIMAIDCVLKDQNEADQYETEESVKNSDLYDICTHGRARFSMFTYSQNDLKKCFLIPEDEVEYYADNNNEIPFNAQNELLKIKVKDFIENYEDLNDYYRTLAGLPPVNTEGLKLSQCKIDYTITGLDLDPETYIHKMTDSQIEIFDSYGLIDEIYEANPTYKYLRFVGKRKIDSNLARKAFNFSILYIPMCDSIEVYNKFIEALEVNRVYFLNTLYSEAQKLDSPYYDKTLMFLIIINSMMDVIGNTQQFLSDREIFDLRTVKYILEANGVEYFPDIPLKYQKRLVRNLNTLIKYKATDKNIVDICNLFGFDDIEIFKYYLYKQRKIDENGNYVTIVDEDNNEDDDSNYELKFIRVPVDDILDNHIRNTNSHMDYDDITFSDKTWNGPYDSSYVKSVILNKEFTTIRSKYMSIDTITEMTKMSFELPYFLSIINNSDIRKDKLTIKISSLDSSIEFNIVDVFVYLYALMYIYNDYEDSIMDTTTKVMYIMGFNFETDMSELASYVEQQGFTLEELGVDGFMSPKDGIFTFDQLLQIYTTNKNIHDHIIEQMNNANNYKIYKVYKYIYDALMVTELNNDVFTIGDGTIAPTYTAYLEYKNPIMHDSIMSIKDISDLTLRQLKISEILNSICDIIYSYLGTTDLRYIFSNLPTISVDYIKQYMFKVVNFFKSYRITLLDVGTIYKISELNRLTVIDNLWIQVSYDKDDFIILKDKEYTSVKYDKSEYILLDDRATIEYIYNFIKKYSETISITESIAAFRILFDRLDRIKIEDSVYVKFMYNKISKYIIKDNYSINSIYFKSDKIVQEDIIRNFTRIYSKKYEDNNKPVITDDYKIRYIL